MPRVKLVGAGIANVPRLPSGTTSVYANQTLDLTFSEWGALSAGMKSLFDVLTPDAEMVPFDPAGTVSATNVQDALEEVATEAGGAHPNLAAHDALGLATQAELDAHAAGSHALVIPRGPTGWAIAGEITATTMVGGISIPVPSGWTCSLTRGRHYIESGTSLTWRLQRNGADITGWGTSAAPLSSSTTAATNDPADVAISDWDKLDIVWGVATGTPTTWSLILELVYSKAA